MRWRKVSLIGVGLLGGSLGLALRQRRLAGEVMGYVRRPASVTECHQCGVVDQADLDLGRVVAGADLVILCTPVGQMCELTRRFLPVLRPGALVTDVGSVKARIVEQLTPLIASVGGHFIGSHPMAGGEKFGVQGARADLFEQATCAVTPCAESEPGEVERVEEFWRALGASPLRLAPELHDDLVSRCSHLPHVVAAELVNYVLDPLHPSEQAMLCGSGFRDTTRVASGSPEMWRDICQFNREKLVRELGVFMEELEEFRQALHQADWRTVSEFFEQARQRREAWVCRLVKAEKEGGPGPGQEREQL